MKRILFPALILCACGLDAGTLHWYEAEDFKSVAGISEDASASGGKCLTGKTWYCFVKDVPLNIGKEENLHLWVRVKSDVPANWFMMREDKKAFNWFSSDGKGWQWVRIGSITGKIAESDKNRLPGIFLQRPKSASIPSAQGWMDVLAVTDLNTPEELEKLRISKNVQERNGGEKMDSGLLEFLAQQYRIAECPILPSPPVIDGRLDDPAWKYAAKLDHFMTIAGKGFAKQQTLVQVGRDAENLYLSAELRENKLPFIRKTKTRKNDMVWTDDCLEIFIDPGLMQKNPHQFTVNALGTRQDNLLRKIDEAWFPGNRLDWEASAVIGTDAWYVEVKIPWRLLAEHMPEEGSAWGFNVCRNQSPDRELSYWNNTGEFFGRAEGFGILLFSTLKSPLSGITADTGQNRVVCHFAKACSGSVIRMELRQDGKTLSSEEKPLPDSDRAVSVSFPVPIEKAGTYLFHTRIREEAGRNVSFDLPLKTYSRGIASSAWPAEERGNVLHLMDGTAQHCFFIIGNHGRETLKRPSLHLIVPDGIEILDPASSLPSIYYKVGSPAVTKIRRQGRDYRKYEFRFAGNLSPVRLEKQPFHKSVLLYFKNRTKIEKERVEKIYYCLHSGSEVEEEHSFDLKLLPASPGRQPKHYTIHNWLWTIAPSPANWPDAVKTQALAGFNSVEAASVMEHPEYIAELRTNNLSIYNNLWWHWQGRGYSAETAAVGFDGKKHDSAICPTLLMEKDGALFRKIHEKHFRYAKEKRMDGLIWDLEGPAVWEICFCSRCIEAFRRWAKLPEGEVLSPERIRDAHAMQWIQFACNQAAQMGKAFRDGIRRVRPDGKYGFYSAVPSLSTMENYRADWSNAGKYIDIALPSYYASGESALDRTFTGDMKKVIREIRAAAGHPIQVWATLTAGYGRNTTVAPSASLVKMKILRSIASGMDGVSFWWWGPFDGLYYKKTAEATRLIADFEDFFRQGEKGSSVHVQHTAGARMSTFLTRKDGLDFIILFNHNAKNSRSAIIHLERPLNSYLYPSGVKISEKASFSVNVPPLDVSVILAGEKDHAAKRIHALK